MNKSTKDYAVTVTLRPAEGCTWAEVDEDFREMANDTLEMDYTIEAWDKDEAETLALDEFHQDVCIGNLEAADITVAVKEVE